MLLRALALVALTGVAVSCGGKAQTTPTTSSLPPGCSLSQANAIVTTFLRSPSLAPPSFFRVVSITDPDGRRFVSRDAVVAEAHLRARVRAGEQDRLLDLRVAPVDFNHVAIAFDLTRYAPDFAARKIRNRLARGTGILDCAHQKVASWMVTPD